MRWSQRSVVSIIRFHARGALSNLVQFVLVALFGAAASAAEVPAKSHFGPGECISFVVERPLEEQKPIPTPERFPRGKSLCEGPLSKGQSATGWAAKFVLGVDAFERQRRAVLKRRARAGDVRSRVDLAVLSLYRWGIQTYSRAVSVDVLRRSAIGGNALAAGFLAGHYAIDRSEAATVLATFWAWHESWLEGKPDPWRAQGEDHLGLRQLSDAEARELRRLIRDALDRRAFPAANWVHVSKSESSP
jgi:hypothetical protein